VLGDERNTVLRVGCDEDAHAHTHYRGREREKKVDFNKETLATVIIVYYY
jgi:hypothetical protein